MEIEPGAIDILLGCLDTEARFYDTYEYGLPMHDEETVERMRGILRDWLTEVLDLPKEKPCEP